jgi:hypothetical protein
LFPQGIDAGSFLLPVVVEAGKKNSCDRAIPCSDLSAASNCCVVGGSAGQKSSRRKLALQSHRELKESNGNSEKSLLKETAALLPRSSLRKDVFAQKNVFLCSRRERMAWKTMEELLKLSFMLDKTCTLSWEA